MTPPTQQALKSRLLRDLVRSMAAGHLLQPAAVAALVGRDASELLQDALGEQDRSSREANERLQRYLRDMVAALSRAERQCGDVLLAVRWYRAHGGVPPQGPVPEAPRPRGADARRARPPGPDDPSNSD